MRGLLPLVLAAVAVPAAARAEVVVDDGVPFTAAELSDALAARAGDVPPPDVRVTTGEDEYVRIATPLGTWEVPVGGARGASAARIVALHLVAIDGFVVIPPPGASAAEVGFAPSFEGLPRHRRGSVRFRAGAVGGVQEDDLTASVLAVELATTRRGIVLASEVAFHITEPSGGVGSVRTTFAQLRYTAGLRRGPFELVAGPFAGMAFVRMKEERPDAFMFGLGTSARFRYSLGGNWTGEVALGLDAHRHRIVLRSGGEPVAATPRIALMTTFGVTYALPNAPWLKR